jgi:hypothetical protein
LLRYAMGGQVRAAVFGGALAKVCNGEEGGGQRAAVFGWALAEVRR